mgnify:CR=1 FL=1
MRKVEEVSLSDHKPKSMKIVVSERRWRDDQGDKRKKRMQREMLRDEGKMMDYKEQTRRGIGMLIEREEEESIKWDDLTEVMVETARKVYG